MIKMSFGRKVSLPGYNNVEVRMEAEADSLGRATDVLNELEGMVGERLNIALEAAGQPAQFGEFVPCKLLVSREILGGDGPLAFIVNQDYELPENLGRWYAIDHGHRASYLEDKHDDKYLRDCHHIDQSGTTKAIISRLIVLHVLAYARAHNGEVLAVDLNDIPEDVQVCLFNNSDAGKEAMRQWFDLSDRETAEFFHEMED